MIEITAALTSTMAALNLAKAGLEARDDAKVRMALVEAHQRLFAMSTSLNQLQTALYEAERETRELKARLDQRGSYVLHEVATGRFCYASEASEDGVQPAHYVCQLCFDRGVKSVLRLVESQVFGKVLDCAESARHEIRITMGDPNPYRRVISRGIDR